MSKLLIFIADTGEPNGDRRRLEQAARSKAMRLRWGALKDSKVGDKVLFVCGRDFIAHARVTRAAAKGGSFGHEAHVGHVRMLPKPIPVKRFVRDFPDWRWLRLPWGKAVVPDEYRAKLLDGVLHAPVGIQITIMNGVRHVGQIKKAAVAGGQLSCLMPKLARAGDEVCIYATAPISAIVGVGRLVADPVPGGDGTFGAKLRDVRLLKNPIKLEELRFMFPRWRWLLHVVMFAYVPSRYQTTLRGRVERDRPTPGWRDDGSRSDGFAQYWVMRSRPADNDLKALVGGRPESNWFTTKQPTLQRGDRVLVWETSPKFRFAAVAEVADGTATRSKDGRFAYRISHPAGLLPNPVVRDECRRHRALANAVFLKPGPMGTFVRITNSEAAAILALIEKRNPGMSKWPRKRSPRRNAKVAAVRERKPLSRDQIEQTTEQLEDRLRTMNSTERSQVISARLGQGELRRLLLTEHQACFVTGISVPDALRASHIKPWSQCARKERLLQENTLLLVANLDALFDRGLISFDGRGRILLSRQLSRLDRRRLGLSSKLRLRVPVERRGTFLEWHRKNVFRG